MSLTPEERQREGSGQFGATELRTVGAYTTPDPWGTLTVANHKHGLAIVVGRNGGRGGAEGEYSENIRFPFWGGGGEGWFLQTW